MAKRKIVWSHRARIKLTGILDFYYQRNKSKAYSKKLYCELQKSTKLLIKQPNLGLKTDIDSVRGFVIGEYIVFYEYTKTEIIIHTIWDCRQNPNDLKIK